MGKLYVENFGPVKKAEIELRSINLFIGAQSIGKSTLAKLITILTDHISLCKLLVGGYEGWLEQLEAYNLSVYSEDKYKIVYDMIEKEHSFHVEIQPKKVTFFMEKGGKKIRKKEDILTGIIALKPIFHGEDILKSIRESEKGNSSKSIFDLMSNSLYIPAERIIYSVITNLLPAFTLAKSSVPQNLLRFMVDLENAKSVFSQYKMPLLNVSYKHEGTEDIIVVDENQKPIPLAAASSGIQSTTPLLLILQYAIEKREYSSFVIEEPECNLFPEKQVELLKHILTIIKSNDRTLTITTHSPYLLSAMNNYLFAGMLVNKYGDSIRKRLNEILPDNYVLKYGECAVYSLGEDINGDGVYCKNLLDEETGMIDYNSLDGVSESLGNDFEAIQDAFIQMNDRD